MERRRDGSIAGRNILITDLGKLRWRSPKVEPHLTRIVKGTIETPMWPAEEATHELRLEDLEDYRTDPSIKRPAGVMEQDGDLIFDAHAGAQPEPTHMLDVEDMMDVQEAEPAGGTPEEFSPEAKEESPSVVASLDTLREIQRQRQEEEAQAARDREVDATIADELGRKVVEIPPVHEEQDIFEAADPEDLIEPADWELPDTTEPVVASPGSRLMLFQNPVNDEGKKVQLTPLCSAALIDYDQNNERAYLRVNHEASGAWERVGLDLKKGTEAARIITDEGVGVLLEGRGRAIDAVILEPVDVIFPNFNVRDSPARQVDSVFWPYTAKDAKPAELGYGYFLILTGGGPHSGKAGGETGFELYLSDKGNPAEYSKNPQYMRRFRLKGNEFKTFRIGRSRVDVALGNLGIRVTRSEPEGTKVKLPGPGAKASAQPKEAGGEAFDDAFAQFMGEESQETEPVRPRRKRITKPLHGFEDVMGGPEQAPPAPAQQPADTISVIAFEELCRTMRNTGLSEQNIRFLIEGISNSDVRIRALAVKAFADVAKKGDDIEIARGYLIAALQDSDMDVKNGANDALFYATANGMELDPVLRATLEDPRRREESSVLLAVQDLKELIPKKD